MYGAIISIYHIRDDMNVRQRFHLLEKNDPTLARAYLVALAREYVAETGDYEDFQRARMLEYTIFPLEDGVKIPMDMFCKYPYEMEEFAPPTLELPAYGFCPDCGSPLFDVNANCACR